MKKILNGIVLSTIVASSLQADSLDSTDWGDIIQVALPVSGLAGTYIADDEEGRWMLVKGFGLNMAVTHTTKQLVEKWRPKGQNADSFPSGHTASAFGGASFIQTRYGYKYGVPAYALAGLVGYTRIISENHYADDVVAGASLAMMSNWAFTEPFVDNITLGASAVNGGLKLTASIPIGGERVKTEPTTVIENTYYEPDVKFIFEFGAVWMQKNDISSPSGVGSTLDFDAFAGTADPTTSIRSGFEFYLDDKNELFLLFSPYEMRTAGAFPHDTYFAGRLFQKSTFPDDTYVSYRLNEYRARWRYDILNSEDFSAKLGAGLSVSDNKVVVEGLQKRLDAPGSHTASTVVYLPIGHAHVGMKIGVQGELYAEVDAGAWDKNHFVDTTVQYRYKLNKHWDVSGGYRYQNFRVDKSELYNHYTADNLVMNLGYSFAY